MDCEQLTEITIPGSVSEIEEQTFAGCSNLSTVTIESGVTSIGSASFTEDTNLKNVYIPDSVTSIADDAFDDRTENIVFTVENNSYGEQFAIEHSYN